MTGVIQSLVRRLFSRLNANPLLDDLEKQKEQIQGEPSPDDVKREKAEKAKALSTLKSILKLFEFSTPQDKLVLLIGSIFTFIHGASFPVFALIFSSLSETFIVLLHSTLNSQNSTDFNTSYPGEDVHEFSKANMSRDAVAFLYSRLSGGNVTIDKEAAEHAIFGFIGQTLSSFGPQPPLEKPEFDYANTLSWAYLGMGLVVFISSFIQTYCWEWAADNQAYRIREKFLYQVLRQELSWFDSRRPGELMVKLAEDIERVREGIGHKFSLLLEYASCFAVGAFLGLVINKNLALLFGSSVPFILIKILFIGSELSAKSVDQQEEYARAAAIASEVLANVRSVAAYGTELVESERYEAELHAGIDKAIKKYNFIAIGTGLLFIIIYSSYALGFWYACRPVAEHEISPRTVYTVFFCVSIGVLALSNILAFVTTTANAADSRTTIMEIINSQPTIDSYSTKGRRLKHVTGKIKFSNVCFNFNTSDGIAVIRDLSFTIKPGETVALIGASGSGKSTIANLLMRFYNHQSGDILVDDADVRGLNVSWLREQIGAVRREPLFEEMSIYDNIRGTRIDVKKEDVIRAAKMAEVHEFIESLPMGYETQLGFYHKRFRTGPRQCLAIARILIKNPKIMILDEALSGLDPKTAAKVYTNIKNSRVGRTTIVLSHRLALLSQADNIFVLQDGEIVEFGTHSDLMAKEGLYFKLAQIEQTLESLIETEPNSLEEKEGAIADQKTSDPKDGDGDTSLPQSDQGATQEHDAHEVEPAKKTVTATVTVDEGETVAQFDKELKFPTANDLLQIVKDEELELYGSLGLAGSVVSGLILPLFAIVFSQLFITFSEHGDLLYQDAKFWMKSVIGVGVISGIAIWLRTIFVSACGEYLTFHLRATTYVTILRQAIGWFEDENNSPGRLYTRLASDAPFIKVAIGTTFATALSAFVAIIGALVVPFWFEWHLGLIMICAVPIFLALIYIQQRTFENHQMAVSRQMESAIRLADKAVQNIWMIQGLNREPSVLRRFKNLIDPAFEESHRQSRSYSFLFALTETIPFLIFGAFFRVGVHLIDTQHLDAILLFKSSTRSFLVTAFCSITLGHVTSFIPDFVKAKLSMAHMFSLYGLESTIDVFEEDGECPPDFPGRVTFNDVYFSYPIMPDDTMVLRGISFELEAGKSLAVIGSQGGKSTLLALLERFYDVKSGEVLVDGIDVRKLNLDYLRTNIALVTPEMNLLDRTVNENIGYGYEGPEKHDPPELHKRIKRLADITNMTEFIEKLPQGFETKVGYNGARLTAGQRRRVLIARAMMRNPRILLLDNPTAALDSENELVVQKMLRMATKGRTCIVASNRPSTVKIADYAAVMVNGKIAEFGTHDELNALKGHYYDFMRASEGY